MNHRQEYLYNSRGYNTDVKDANNCTSRAEYDTFGNITKLTGPMGGMINYTYDEMGRLISETTSSGGSITYGYNALNVKEQLTNARGQVRRYFYDAAGRITGFVGEEDTVSYTYDQNGNVLTVADSKGVIKREYDALNRVTKCTDTFGKVICYEYDAVGNLKRLVYPDNTSVSYDYDENNNLLTVTDWANRVTRYTYDENNRVVGVVKPDGSVTTTVYDNKQRIDSTVERTAAGQVITGFEYTYDNLSRIVEEKHLADNTKICYTYDNLSRVTNRTIKNECDCVISSENFTYDAAGNITDAPNSCFIYDTNNRLITFNGNTVSYDMDGNMLFNGYINCEFDSGNRLISAGGHTYTYNAEDVRIRNLCSDADTTYTYNTNCKLSQLLTKTTNGITTKYVYGNGLIGEEKEGCFKTYHFDFRGSTVAITDQYGNITDTFKYDTYGNLTEHVGNSFVIFGYNGRDGVVTDKNGLIYMRARYYSPAMRRFINADIIHGQISDSTSLNRYSYVNGNPVSFVDPFGLEAERGLGPTALEAAYMAQHAYDAKKSEYGASLGDNFGGWTLEEIFDPVFKNIGLKICVYSRCVNGITTYSVVYVGTNMDFTKDEADENVFVNVIDAISDWYNNITQPIANSPDMRLGIKYAMDFSNKHKDSEITFIGHSKGGAEAAAAALATNKDALLFNPATVNSYAYGLNTKKYTADMTAYIVEGEILNNIFGWMSTPIGDLEWLNSEETGAMNKHSMRAVINALR